MADTPWLARLGALARQRPVEIAVALLLVAGVSAWVYAGVRNALVELAASNLRSLVASEVAILDTWITEKRLNVQRWASDERVVRAVALLARNGDAPAAALQAACRGPAVVQLLATVDALRREDAAAAVHVIDRSGRVLAARDPAQCGQQLNPAQRAEFSAVFDGETRFTATLDEQERIGRAPARREQTPGPKVWIAAPVRDANGQVLALLDIGKPAQDRFSQLFVAARLGATGESFAFDARGRLLSESRFLPALAEQGRLIPGASAILALRVTDSALDVTEPPLSRLISQALAGRADPDHRAGEVLAGYGSYTGERVVGAWRWLPAYDFGVAVEVGAEEALAPLARLENAFFVLAAMIALAVFGLIVALLRIQRMQQEVERARRVGNYELLEEIGQGGMARVYRARHRLLKRPTAVKIIELRVANDEMLSRFDREVRLASQLMHANTVEIYDYGRTPEGQPFYAMEYLDGLTLQQIVEAHGPLPAARVLRVLRGVAASLSEAHERGLIHRDIKPANVMLCRKGGEIDVVKVLDFGLIKDIREEGTRDLTRALKVLGTPAYMAPERIEKPSEATASVDIYAIGAVGYYLLTGRAPFDGDNDLALAFQVVHREHAALPATDDPRVAELHALIDSCLQKDPSMRPASARGLVIAIDAQRLRLPWSQLDARLWWDALPAVPQPAPAAAQPSLIVAQ